MKLIDLKYQISRFSNIQRIAIWDGDITDRVLIRRGMLPVVQIKARIDAHLTLYEQEILDEEYLRNYGYADED
jgi:hypothetical protein